MIERETPFWDCPGRKAIPVTNHVKRNGACAMGSPAGYAAVKRVPGIEYVIGGFVDQYGGHVFSLTPELLSFPFKESWDGSPDPVVIRRSIDELLALVGDERVHLARPGAGRGGMLWEDVRPFFADCPDNIVLVPHV